MRVQEVGEQVQQLSNRATLIALHTLLTGRAEETEEGQDGLHAELKQLAIEVRSATTRVGDLSHELEREIQAATERMRGIRERVALRLEQIPETPEFAETGPNDDLRRLLDRLREMAQDGARKSERVTRSTESASRAAQDVVHRLEEESADLEGVIVRLSPASSEAQSRAGEMSRPAGLKVLERKPNPPGDGQQTRGRGESA
jgi:methyl-accepting chemotaxis protein